MGKAWHGYWRGCQGIALAFALGFGSAQADETASADAAPATVSATAAPAASRGSVTGLMLPRFVSLKGTEARARRGPAAAHRVDWVFTRPSMPLRVTAEYENWRRVEDAEGIGGWVHYTALSGIRTVLVVQDLAEIVGAPDPHAALRVRAESGVILRLLECGGDWCRVSAEGYRGWVHKAAIWGVERAEQFR